MGDPMLVDDRLAKLMSLAARQHPAGSNDHVAYCQLVDEINGILLEHRQMPEGDRAGMVHGWLKVCAELPDALRQEVRETVSGNTGLDIIPAAVRKLRQQSESWLYLHDVLTALGMEPSSGQHGVVDFIRSLYERAQMWEQVKEMVPRDTRPFEQSATVAEAVLGTVQMLVNHYVGSPPARDFDKGTEQELVDRIGGNLNRLNAMIFEAYRRGLTVQLRRLPDPSAGLAGKIVREYGIGWDAEALDNENAVRAAGGLSPVEEGEELSVDVTLDELFEEEEET